MLLGLAVYGQVLGTFKEMHFEKAEMTFMFQDIANCMVTAFQQLSVPDEVISEAQ